MKAFKGCINRECDAFQKRIHYKGEYRYCPYCAQKIEYVCADCWTVLEQNHKRLCPDCQKIHQANRQQKIQQGKGIVAGAVGVAVKAAPEVLKHKKEIIAGGKKAAQMIAKVKK